MTKLYLKDKIFLALLLSWCLAVLAGSILDDWEIKASAASIDNFKVNTHKITVPKNYSTTLVLAPNERILEAVLIVTIVEEIDPVTEPQSVGPILIKVGMKDFFDTDKDGLTNAVEEFIGTDPELPDTDFDGVLDYEEVVAKTDPLGVDPSNVTPMVWATKYGGKYHAVTCRWAKSASSLTLPEALLRGLSPCTTCGGIGE